MTVLVEPRLRTVGDSGILVEFGDEISPEASARVRALDAALNRESPPGLVETLPAYCTLLVEYDPLLTDHDEFARVLAALAHGPGQPPVESGPVKEIPVRYGGEDGPDLAQVAALHGLTPEGVIALHSSTVYTVYMLGFAPGFPYMGTVPEAIATPRLPTPRTAVPAGSVGIAGRQTGIYPLATPGGWRLLGRTDAVLFDPRRDPPALLGPGDRVRFVPVRGGVGEWRGRGEPVFASTPPPLHPSTPLLRVLSPGWLTTVQDAGRQGYQRVGVPRAGAMDPLALRAANLLVGNDPGAAALEITSGGLALAALADVRVAVAGADLDAVIHWRERGPWPVPPWSDLYLRRGSVLEFRSSRVGFRAYLAVAGGLAVEPVMGSRATYLLGGFGGYGGRALAAGDVLRAYVPGQGPAAGGLRGPWREVAAKDRPVYSTQPEVRIVPGPHDDYFAEEAHAVLASATYRVSATSDRMGLRLEGPRLARRDTRELLSTGTALGAIQVPPDGQPIVLMADRQTAGGYPIIGTVATADVPLLAQCMPGASSVRFRIVTAGEAQRAWRAAVTACKPDDANAAIPVFDA